MTPVNAPAISGPVIDPTEINDMASDVTRGRMLGAHVAKMMRSAPLRRPADPMPLTARPTMKTRLVVATAQIMLPASKTSIKAR